MEIPVEISDSPGTNYKRKAIINGFKWETNPQFFLTKVSIHFYENLEDEYGDEVITREVKPYNEELYATNNTFINPLTMDIVSNDFEGAVGEYDFYYSLLLSETQPYPNRQLMIQSVQVADSRERFN